MFHSRSLFVALLGLVFAGLVGAGPAAAQAVWHCSRAGQVAGQITPEAPTDGFQLASSNNASEAIGLSLIDLIDVYSGKTVLLSGRPLSACFMTGDGGLSGQALSALGLNWSSMQQMARQSAIVQSHLQWVADEAGMQACIAKHYPAVGYLSQSLASDRVVPCF